MHKNNNKYLPSTTTYMHNIASLTERMDKNVNRVRRQNIWTQPTYLSARYQENTFRSRGYIGAASQNQNQ